MRISRAERSLLSDWWYSIDGAFLLAMLTLMFAGLMTSLAASPAVALRLDLDGFYFVERHAILLVPALALLVGASFLRPKSMLTLAVVLLGASLLGLLLTLFFGEYIKGARRWIELGGFSVQPSEFAKPALIIVSAYLFAWTQHSNDPRPLILSAALFLATLILLVLQPDYGQSLLIVLIWGGLFFLAGMPWLWLFGLSALAAVGGVSAYHLVSHVRKRIDHFFDPDLGDNYQVGHALRSFLEGGWFGRGPGEGQIKQILPDAHSDFVFAVIAEELGIVVCLALLALFVFVVMRGFWHAARDTDPFRRLALSGLMLQIGLQVFINMGVNLNLLPAKGMTLPFISYGGSSLLAVSLGMGLALGLARRQRGEKRFERKLAAFHKIA